MFGQVNTDRGILRKYVIFFGTLFSDIILQRDDAEKNVVQTFRVPLNYSNKDKLLARLNGNPELERPIAIQVPRMAFEMTSFNYDPARKLNTMGRSACGPTYSYNPVPYDIGFQLNILVKNAEDGTRIVEQILPYFTPSLTASLNIGDGPPIDVPLVLNDVSNTDTYQGSFEVRRELIWTLDFTLKGWVFGPSKDTNAELIKHVDVNLSIPGIDLSLANTTNTVASTTIEVYPGVTAANTPVSWDGWKYSANHPTDFVDPITVDRHDNWDFITDFSDRTDE